MSSKNRHTITSSGCVLKIFYLSMIYSAMCTKYGMIDQYTPVGMHCACMLRREREGGREREREREREGD